tara:strand:- start:23 stop:325 length:303 start_codon:yes stop_codon:yes gene_type:complete
LAGLLAPQLQTVASLVALMEVLVAPMVGHLEAPMVGLEFLMAAQKGGLVDPMEVPVALMVGHLEVLMEVLVVWRALRLVVLPVQPQPVFQEPLCLEHLPH